MAEGKNYKWKSVNAAKSEYQGAITYIKDSEKLESGMLWMM